MVGDGELEERGKVLRLRHWMGEGCIHPSPQTFKVAVANGERLRPPRVAAPPSTVDRSPVSGTSSNWAWDINGTLMVAKGAVSSVEWSMTETVIGPLDFGAVSDGNRVVVG